MQFLGLVFGIFSIIGMFVAFLPLLGWMNWGVIPFAVEAEELTCKELNIYTELE